MKIDIYTVSLTARALKDLEKVPIYIAIKFQAWVDDISRHGLSEVRKIPGYHDEPLKGKRKGQRSIRLNRAYRAIYIIEANNTVKFIEVQEVNKHEY